MGSADTMFMRTTGTSPSIFAPLMFCMGFQTTARHFSTVTLSQNHERQAAQLDLEIAELRERQRTIEADRDAILVAHSSAEERANSLTEQLARARSERDDAKRAIISAEAEYRTTIDQISKRYEGTERLLKQALSSVEEQLRANRAELARMLRYREGDHLKRIDALVRDKERTEERLLEELTSAKRLVDDAENVSDILEQRISDLVLRLEMADGLIRKALAEPIGVLAAARPSGGHCRRGPSSSGVTVFESS